LTGGTSGADPAPGTAFYGPAAMQTGNSNYQHNTFVLPGTHLDAPADEPRPVKEWTAQQLGVHPAITGSDTRSDLPADFVLPRYIEREHDRRLRALLKTAAGSQRPVMVVVRGGSCTGKTRTAFEAVRERLSGWDLVFPKTAASLLTVVSSPAFAPRTVLWLNEAQDHLSGPDGEAAAAALRTLLERRGPIVILATLWPAHHHALTATAPFGAADIHPQARALLGPITLIDVPGSFGEQDLRGPQTLLDRSLTTAIRTSPGGRITQTLAAGACHVAPAGWGHGGHGTALAAGCRRRRHLRKYGLKADGTAAGPWDV
jgi:hypothetical protein